MAEESLVAGLPRDFILLSSTPVGMVELSEKAISTLTSEKAKNGFNDEDFSAADVDEAISALKKLNDVANGKL